MYGGPGPGDLVVQYVLGKVRYLLGIGMYLHENAYR